MFKRPEILAPCGNMKSLKAAIAAGADACYLAGNSFGARAYAENFSDDELIEAIKYAHLHNVKVYLTCNTLIKNNELIGVYHMLEPLTDAGLDAVLVQDYGVMRLVREYLPELPIHTSTQMNILTVEGAKLAKARGAERIVAAREMTIEELARIKKEADIEVEAFVHGAMCLCYSGRCLMSSMIGGRSGNRGRCAQPCRQKYNGEYLLSMRDLCTLEYIPQLIEAGIDSLKIEGRMKNEYYTAATVEAYRILVDEYINGSFTEDKVKKYENRLLDVFNRGGFSSGYMGMSVSRDEDNWDEILIDSSMPGRRGVKVGSVNKISDGQIFFNALTDISVGDDLLIDTDVSILITSNKEAEAGELISLKAPETRRISKGMNIYRTRSRSLTSELESVLSGDNRLPISGKVRAVCGKKLRITLSRGNISVTVKGDIVEKASNRPVDKDTISNKVSQLGNTDFYMEKLDVETDGEAFVRIGDLSELRRDAVQELYKAISDSFVKGQIYSREHNEDCLRSEAYATTKTIAGDNYYFSFSYPYQVEAFLENLDNFNEIQEISGDIYMILDLGLGGYSKENRKEYEKGYKNSQKIFDDELIEDLSKNIKARMLEKKLSNKLPDKLPDKLPNIKISLGLPYINRGEYTLDDLTGITSCIDSLYIRNIDDLAMIAGAPLIGDAESLLKYRRDFQEMDLILASSIYAYNNMSVTELFEILQGHGGKVIFESSLEFSKRDIDNMDYRTDFYSVYYGKLPLMVTSGLRDTTGILKDDKGYKFKSVKCDGLCYNVILGDRPQSLHDYNLKKMYSFTDETAAEVKDVLSYDPKYIRDRKYTRGHIDKGVL